MLDTDLFSDLDLDSLSDDEFAKLYNGVSIEFCKKVQVQMPTKLV